ncbi:hypothetical protein [Yinghuangia seranimata]|uniref:hypothetical protein n=1 Tax=Yinghuangia seranimata TaxID=408067 RepID=UPI00248BC466|nr:hypothetical protein [Yinghuangia seranimata]MDI2125244.1 hypothetical protein [Yinghuangia seranimata]
MGRVIGTHRAASANRSLWSLLCTLALCVLGIAAAPATSAETGTAGTVFSWGQSFGANLGRPAVGAQPVPLPVCPVGSDPAGPCPDPLAGATAVSASSSTGAAVVDGAVLAWGKNFNGRVGDGTTTHRVVPVPVCAVGAVSTGRPCAQFLTGARDVAVMSAASYALLNDGTVAAWGANGRGQLGDGTTAEHGVPTRVCAVGATAPCGQYLSGIVAISPGGYASNQMLALDAAGRVYAWGANDSGQLGDGTTTDRSTPVRVCAPGQTAPCAAYLDNAVSVATGSGHSIAATTTGAAYAWGTGYAGIGDGTNGPALTPSQVCAVGATAPCGSHLAGITKVYGHSNTFAALDGAGNLYMWGDGGTGKIGDGTTDSHATPVAVCAPGQTSPCAGHLTGVAKVAVGLDHTMAVLTNGDLYTWGGNTQGELGTGTTDGRTSPGRACAVAATAPCAAYLTRVTSIAAAGVSIAVQGPPTPDLAVTTTAAVSGLLLPTVTVTAKVDNVGSAATTGSTLTFSYPSGFTNPVAAGCTVNTSARTVTCTMGAIAPGANAQKSVKFSPGLLTIGSNLTVTAVSSGATPTDPVTTNNTDGATCSVLTGLIVQC